MDRYKETFNTWNKIASLYQSQFMDLDVYHNTYDFICKSITADKPNLLEIGCGPGNITKYLLSKRPDFLVLGIDISPNMIALAKTNNPTARFEVKDCREIDEIKITYDGIICGFCLPYLSHADSRKLIADCSNLLHENGFIYLSFVEGEPSQSDFQMSSSGDRTYFYFYHLDDLKELFQEHQFENLNVFHVEYQNASREFETHTILTANKKMTDKADRYL